MYPSVPIVQGQIPASVRGALYPHGAAANADFIAGSSATHVFLGHGDSDKPLSASDRVLQYDIIAVAGQAAIDRFAAAGLYDPGRQSFRIIGRPQTEGIVAGVRILCRARRPCSTRRPGGTPTTASTSRRSPSPTGSCRPCSIAGAPSCSAATSPGQNHLEAEAMIVHVNELLEADAASTGRPHRWGQAAMNEPLIEAFNSVDAMVSDVSGIVVDFMASNKPLVMYARSSPTRMRSVLRSHTAAGVRHRP